MKQINRSQMRGKPLDDDCKNAHVCSIINEEGTKECYCYGIIDLYNDEYLDKCRECKAFEKNIEY